MQTDRALIRRINELERLMIALNKRLREVEQTRAKVTVEVEPQQNRNRYHRFHEVQVGSRYRLLTQSGTLSGLFTKRSDEDMDRDTAIICVSGQTMLKPGTPLYRADGVVIGRA